MNVLAIDQGTSATKALVVGDGGQDAEADGRAEALDGLLEGRRGLQRLEHRGQSRVRSHDETLHRAAGTTSA